MEAVPFPQGRLRTIYQVEPSRMMRADGFEWEHEIRVALPPSYSHTDRNYPVLWVTDNMLELALSVLQAMWHELIVVSVGADSTVPVNEVIAHRVYDFWPTEDRFPAGPGGDYVRADPRGKFLSSFRGGGAQTFLDFLVDDVRPLLQAEYRMDPDDHGLIGHPGGGSFVAYALFARPGAFKRYICGSPALYNCNGRIFEMEQEYADTHDDLPAHVFFGAGEAEMTETLSAATGNVSSMVKMAETLSFRGYPSLRLTVKVFPGESHGSVAIPLFTWGVQSVWAR
jgi:predicted alpha/beta superfamily hydrolase